MHTNYDFEFLRKYHILCVIITLGDLGMKMNARLLLLARKYHELKAVHKFALCQAAESNQNSFKNTAKLLLEANENDDIRTLKAYLNRHSVR